MEGERQVVTEAAGGVWAVGCAGTSESAGVGQVGGALSLGKGVGVKDVGVWGEG